MREILFRGKRTDNGQWVEGSLRIDYLTNKLNQGSYLMFISNQNRYSFDFDSVQVQSESVGQFTGLLDKNGKKIFEGDIVEGITFSGKKYFLSEIKFINGFFKTVVKGWETKSSVGSWCIDLYVIGNIHDNPELL